MRKLYRLLVDDDGPTAVEYAVMLAMVVAVMTGAIAAVGTVSKGVFQSTSEAFEPSTSGTSTGSTGTGGKSDGNTNGAGQV